MLYWFFIADKAVLASEQPGLELAALRNFDK